ncbi:hypothetical protein HIM_07826 [Hirsutella minnesotensis 3608]|uniref:Uncharacterized protein n=1 Tax=Hirsutella minnesotensis 3608 TaxID=1043627 RepID=A0A0F7ZHJ5_9HYPO|nr:hypothetical protein HIM_07826 [Hirsutella minnesotensis 3608]
MSEMRQTVVHRASPATKPSSKYMTPYSSIPIPAFFWGNESWKQYASSLPRHTGNVEARKLIGNGSYGQLERLVTEALQVMERIYGSVEQPDASSPVGLVDLRLSDDLNQWKREQEKAGRVLPAKCFGLRPATDRGIQMLQGEDWPAPLLTANALFGSGWANLSIGTYDPRVLYSNYCCDMTFYYEHGFHKVFPEFERAIHISGNADPYSRSTFAGSERRKASELGRRYICGKVDFETKLAPSLAGKSARVDRRTMQVVGLSESSLLGMGAEAISRGFDPAAVMADLLYASPATDVVDVGSDLGNSEVMNWFLMTADVTDSGIITEEILRRVYDAFSHSCGLILTERWTEPTALMNAALYVWHFVNDRHFFLRRAVLGYPKARRTAPDQREGDLDEVFDERNHTTGFSRPLKNRCNGRDTCNQVTNIIENHPASDALGQLWWHLVTGPLDYVRRGVVDGQREEKLVIGLQEILAQNWHNALVHEMNWLMCHASQHAWQVNFLMETAMFGSLLDDGGLSGKLDRIG